MHFCLERRTLVKDLLEAEWAEVAKDFGDLTESTKTRSIFGNTTRRLSILWNFVGKEVKAKYTEMAAKDKQRFDEEMATNPMNAILFNEEKELKSLNIKRKNATSLSYLNESDYLNDLASRNQGISSSGGGGGGGGGGQDFYAPQGQDHQQLQSHAQLEQQRNGKKRPKTQKFLDGNGVEIKKPLTSYFHFCAQYRAQAAEDVRIMDMEKLRSEDSGESSGSTGSSSGSGSLSKESNSPPPSAGYSPQPPSLLMGNQVGSVNGGNTGNTEKELPGITKVVIRLGELWRALTPQQKQVFDDMALQDKLRYEAAIQSNPGNSWVSHERYKDQYAKIALNEEEEEMDNISYVQQTTRNSSSHQRTTQHHPSSSRTSSDGPPFSSYSEHHAFHNHFKGGGGGANGESSMHPGSMRSLDSMLSAHQHEHYRHSLHDRVSLNKYDDSLSDAELYQQYQRQRQQQHQYQHQHQRQSSYHHSY
jgi:hypothetical protein